MKDHEEDSLYLGCYDMDVLHDLPERNGTELAQL